MGKSFSESVKLLHLEALEPHNIRFESHDNFLHFVVDLTKNCGRSSTGKSIKVASTPGPYTLGVYRFNLQVTRPLMDITSSPLPDYILAPKEEGVSYLKDLGENPKHWLVQTVKTGNGKIMDVCVRRAAWNLLRGGSGKKENEQ